MLQLQNVIDVLNLIMQIHTFCADMTSLLKDEMTKLKRIGIGIGLVVIVIIFGGGISWICQGDVTKQSCTLLPSYCPCMRPDELATTGRCRQDNDNDNEIDTGSSNSMEAQSLIKSIQKQDSELQCCRSTMATHLKEKNILERKLEKSIQDREILEIKFEDKINTLTWDLNSSRSLIETLERKLEESQREVAKANDQLDRILAVLLTSENIETNSNF